MARWTNEAARRIVSVGHKTNFSRSYDMRRISSFLAVAAAILMIAPSIDAQAKPSFAGTWTMIPDSTAAAGGGGGGRAGRGGGMLGGLGQMATIAQDAKTLTVTRTLPARGGGAATEIKSVYNLDGSESKNTLTFGANAIEQSSKAAWEGNKLVIKTTTNVGGNPTESTMALSLDAAGMLQVESTGAGRGGAAPTTTKLSYKKG
jgi:hypothetical protein